MVTRPGFVAGVRSLFGGAWWVITTPACWPFAIVPVLVAIVLAGGFGTVSVAYAPKLIDHLIGPTHGGLAGAGVAVLSVVAALVGIVVALLLALALAQPISGPALERLVREQEAALGAPTRPHTPFLLDMVRGLKSLVVPYAFGLPILALLFVVSLLVPVASVVTVPLKLVVAAFMVAWDLCEFPLNARGLRVRARMAIVWRHKSAVLGFGAGMALAGLVPCLQLLLLPAGVVGATRLLWEVDRHAATKA
jgi:CysZ protein